MKDINETQKSKALKLTESLADDFSEEEAESFASSHQDKSWYADFMLLLNMVMDSDYTISTRTKLLIGGTLAYVILPIDIIPDLLPIVGWLDDAFVLGYTMNALAEEIAEYKIFKGIV